MFEDLLCAGTVSLITDFRDHLRIPQQSGGLDIILFLEGEVRDAFSC